MAAAASSSSSSKRMSAEDDDESPLARFLGEERGSIVPDLRWLDALRSQAR